jgi:hypothetical protein
MKDVETSPVSGSSSESPRREASSAALGEQMSTYGKALVKLSNSEGVQRSGTGSHMKIGFGWPGLSRFRDRRMVVTSSMHRFGEHNKWKDLEKSKVRSRSSAVRRRFGVVYLKARFSEES